MMKMMLGLSASNPDTRVNRHRKNRRFMVWAQFARMAGVCNRNGSAHYGFTRFHSASNVFRASTVRLENSCWAMAS